MFHRDKGFRRTAGALVLLLTGSLGGATFQQAGSGVVGYWKFDESSGPAQDSSGNPNNSLTWFGPPSPSASVPAVSFPDPKSLSFNGSSSYVSSAGLSNFSPGNTPHTTAAWVYVNNFPPSTRAWILLLGNATNGAEHWLIDTSGNTQLGVYGASVNFGQFAPILSKGQWTHLALTFDGTNLSAYVNGKLQGVQPATYNFAGGGSGVPLTVAQAHIGENSFDGSVDDLRLYSRALDASEISALAGGSSGPAAPTGLTAVPGNFSVLLNWTDSTGPGPLSYSVGRSLVAGGSPPGTYAIITSGLNSPTYTDNTVTNGTTYYYVVYDESFGQSPPSNEASATSSVSGVTSKGGKGEVNCGATGLEVLLPLGVLGLLRRRRR